MSAILITGVPGAGKTTVAKKLAEKLGYDYINVNELVEECRAILEIERDACGNPIKVVDMDKIEECFKERYSKRKTVVEGVVVDFVPPELVEKVIVLRVDPLVILERLLQRGYCIEKACENAEAELIGSYIPYLNERYGDRVYEVLCDNKCLKKVEAIIIGKGHRENVNWFDRVEELLSKCSSTQIGFEATEMKN